MARYMSHGVYHNSEMVMYKSYARTEERQVQDVVQRRANDSKN